MSAPAVTDAQLIARALVEGDQHAFAELVRRHQSAVRACLRKLTSGNHALADDLAQETFLLAWRNLKSFRQEARFSTWLYRIATNAWLATVRKRRELLLGDQLDAQDDEESDVMAQLAGQEADPHAMQADHARTSMVRLDLESAMALLSEGERAAIVQCYHNDLSHEEAAYVLDCPVGTVKTNILRGKQKLKAALAGYGN